MTDANHHASVADVTEASIRAESEFTPGAKLGRYVILDRLGAGGMGVVLSAYDPELDRRIAIKLLASSRIEDEARRRLLREAQAMARLSHPHVVPVYDVGTVDGRVFVAMEFVEGLTLRSWLEREPRPWTDVLDTMRWAALGLQAVHEAGLVHRDFKPDNVMVGDDGRVRVLDFGLARGGTPDGALATRDGATGAGRRVSRSDKALATPLTSHGAVLGTPAYMPPEQLEGLPVDARADQWSFCATLYEALYGSRPFEASTVAASVVAMHNDGLPPPPDSSPVPRSVFAAIARGLEVDPSARHPSMKALLDALEPRAVAPRRRAFVVATAAGAAVAGTLWWNATTAEPSDPACESRATAASRVWSERAQRAGAASFADSTVSFRAEAWARSSERITAYVESWNHEAGQACRASSPETAEVDALRTKCLDDRLRRLSSVADAFANANDDVVRGAIETAFDLPSVQPCTDTVGLLAAVRPPDDPAERAELERLEDELDAAAAHEISAEYAEGRRLAQVVVDQARQLAHDPFTAQALLTVATFDRKQSDYEAARDGCVEAFELAASAHDDQGAARIATELVFLLGYELGSPDGAHAWTTMAATMVARAGKNQQTTEASLHNAMGNVAFAQGDYERARDEFSAALDIWEALPGDHPIQRGTALSNLGAAYATLGRYDDAFNHHQRALHTREGTFGPEHPEVATSLGHLGIVARKRGDLTNARALQERGLAIKRATLPPGHPSIATSAMNLGGLLLKMGELDDGIRVLEEALDVFLASRGPDHPAVAATLANLAEAYAHQGRYEDSEASFRRVLEIQRQALGREHPAIAATLDNFGELMLRMERPESAAPLAEEALAIRSEALDPDHADLGDSWYLLSRVHEANGRRAQALDAAHRALEALERGDHDEFLAARRRTELGQLQWRLQDDRAAARRMVQDAAAILDKTPEREPAIVAETHAWLRAHPPPG